MLLLAITIKLPWWCWLLFVIGLPVLGVFYGWKHSKASLKGDIKGEVKKIAEDITGKN